MNKISWKAFEYLHTEKTSDWYWIVGIISVSIAILAVIFNNLIFALLILVSAATLSLFASRPPHLIEISIDAAGVTIGKTRYPYVHLESFWVETNEHYPRLLLKSKKVLMPFIVALIEEHDVHPDEIRTFLLNHLPEEEHTEPLLEKVLLYLGF